jgi:hypothetical protein
MGLTTKTVLRCDICNAESKELTGEVYGNKSSPLHWLEFSFRDKLGSSRTFYLCPNHSGPFQKLKEPAPYYDGPALPSSRDDVGCKSYSEIFGKCELESDHEGFHQTSFGVKTWVGGKVMP